MKKFKVGDKVVAARKFKHARFRFSGVTTVVNTKHHYGLSRTRVCYVLENNPSFNYYAEDLNLVCNHDFNDECNKCQYKYLCWTGW